MARDVQICKALVLLFHLHVSLREVFVFGFYLLELAIQEFELLSHLIVLKSQPLDLFHQHVGWVHPFGFQLHDAIAEPLILTH